MRALLLSGLVGMSWPIVATEMAELPSSNQSDRTVVISNQHVNRIVTPFKHPSIKLDSVGGVAYKARDNVLYVSTTHTAPLAGFITETGDESAAITVILKPMAVGPQEVILQGQSSEGSALARRFERSSPRAQTIKTVMTSMAKGTLPSGYSMRSVDAHYIPSCQQKGLAFDFYNGQRVSGGDYVVSIGTVSNDSTQPIEFKENHCYQDGVVSVSAYPNVKLLPKEASEVYVMFYRHKPTAQKTQTRRSLLGGGHHE